MSEVHRHGADLLRGKRSLKEILEQAMAFEATAREFYTELLARVSKPNRELVQALADEEARHYQLFADLAARTDLVQSIAEMVQVPASDAHFSDYIQCPDLEQFPGEQSILQYALSREQAAMEQYRALAEELTPGPIQDLFRFLADEELRHKGELEKRYYELVYAMHL